MVLIDRAQLGNKWYIYSTQNRNKRNITFMQMNRFFIAAQQKTNFSLVLFWSLEKTENLHTANMVSRRWADGQPTVKNKDNYSSYRKIATFCVTYSYIMGII